MRQAIGSAVSAKIIKSAIGAASLMLLAACDTMVDLKQPQPSVVRVFYATDREVNAGASVHERFGSERATLSYGVCLVSIPPGHKPGELETPSLLRLEFNEDPAKHVVLFKATPQPKDAFFSELSARVRRSPVQQAFVFIHGYNVTFEQAAQRTAQMSYDLGFDGAAVFYSWPSQGTLEGYTIDESNVEWTRANLKGFLVDFLAQSDAKRIHIIAHSMGSRAVANTITSLLTESAEARNRFGELIFTAPDIDADIFVRDIAPVLAKTQQATTLYSSSDDIALEASKEVNGYPRAGDAGEGLVVVPGIETIDATNADTSFYGHSYFAEAQSVLDDISRLINTGQRAHERPGLRAVETPRGIYWAIE